MTILSHTVHLSRIGLQLKKSTLRTERSQAYRPMSVRAGAKGEAISGWIEEHLECGPVVKKSPMGSSSWSSASVYHTESGQKFFVKEARSGGFDMFRGEALGLQAMHETGTLRIPKVYHFSLLPGGGACIVMEHLTFGGRSSQEDLGRALAQMHLAPVKDPNAQQGKFGFEVDNTIGGTEQPNGWMDNWVDFFAERRIGHMLRLIGDSELNELGRKLLPKLGKFFEGVEVKPSLLHGDLWSGNMSTVEGGQWAILDPAVYYGHHEAEFGMSWCAGFGPAFWRGYRSIIPEDPGFADRKQLYLSFHYLNHTLLFDGGYRSQAIQCLQHLVQRL